MSDAERALLRTILERPEDDTPRLVLADWLEENAGEVECPRCEGGRKLAGVDREAYTRPPLQPKDLCMVCHGESSIPNSNAERAEFIRVQVELARLPARRPRFGSGMSTAMVDPLTEWRRTLDALRRRERELLTAENALRWGPSKDLWDAGLKLPTCTLNFMDSRPQGWVGLEFRRGFVAEVSCPLATLFGGVPCPLTHATGTVCRVCHGTGTTPGVAAALFAAHPVTRVTLSDRDPEHDGTTTGWIRTDDELNEHGRPDALPIELFDLLSGGRTQWDSVNWVRFATRAAALDALSAACVALGRSLAGLPELPRTINKETPK